MSYEQVTVADGKYTVQIGAGTHAGQLNALRHGEPWQDLTGNNLVYWLAVELRNARAELNALKRSSAEGDEPLYLLHCGRIDSSGEQDDWDIQADSYKRVEEFCRLHPGKTIKLYPHVQPKGPEVSDLLDGDGENRAVRAFLMLYGGACGVTCGQMLDHLTNSGFPHAPFWVVGQRSAHLTKGGAQSWLRYLLGLETAQAPAPAPEPFGYLSEQNVVDGPFKWQFSKTLAGIYRDSALHIWPVYLGPVQAPAVKAEVPPGPWEIFERKSKTSDGTVFLVWRSVVDPRNGRRYTEYMRNPGKATGKLRQRPSTFRSREAAEKAIAVASKPPVQGSQP